MSTRFRLGAVSALVGMLVTVTACGGAGSSTGNASGGSSGGQDAKITFAITPASTSACVQLTGERGVFKSHGLDVAYIPAPPNSAAQIAQILSGQITAGLGAYTSVIAAVSNNLPIVATNGQDQDFEKDGQTAFATIVSPNSGITSFKQLEGKTVAVNSLQGTWEVTLREAVAQAGGDPSKVKLVAIPFPSQATALKSGRVDAISTLQPLIAQITAEGYRSLGDAQAIALGKKNNTTAVTFMAKKFVEANPDVVNRFQAGLQEGNAWCNSHPADMVKAIARITKVPEAVVAKAPVPVFEAKVDLAEAKAWSELLVKYGILKQAPPVEQILWSGAPKQ